MPVTIQDLEQALHDLWDGYTLTTLEGPKAVEVFVDHPDIEEFPDRVYPSLSILFMGMEWDSRSNDSEEFIEVARDEGSVPYIVTSRQNSEWYRFKFQINAWSLDAAADRALTRWVETRLRPQDYVVANGADYWIFRTGFASLDETQPDRVVYHKAWTFEVLADFDNEDTDEQAKAVHEIEFTTGLVETRLVNAFTGKGRVELLETGVPATLSERTKPRPVDASGNPVSAKDAVFYRHRTIAFTDSDFTVLP